MHPTTKMRLLQIHMGRLRGDHPSAFHQDGTQFAMVLQQWYETPPLIDDSGTETRFGEWRDIPIEQAG